MSARLAGKVAIVVGAGQTPGDGVGNGRAAAIVFAREGARVIAVDIDEPSAEETVAMIAAEGGVAEAVGADATSDEACRELVAHVVRRYGHLDVLHNNVGIGHGDTDALRVDDESWSRIMDVNLKSVVFPCKHALPVMRAQRAGSIVNISSAAAVVSTQSVIYKTSKAGVNAYTQSLAIANAKHGVRANVLMPGMLNTPMAIVGLSRALGVDPDELIRQRDALVPLRAKQGTAWDLAYAALFLHSDEAQYITGVVLPVDGGISARVGVDPI
jgi:NAD(P)-dependent dehydrogenase (short-subunit alcohol dehydrogenase family)